MKRCEVVLFKADAGPGLPGKRGQVLRRSRRTGGLTVELLEPAGAYKKGDTVHVQPYQVQPYVVTR